MRWCCWALLAGCCWVLLGVGLLAGCCVLLLLLGAAQLVKSVLGLCVAIGCLVKRCHDLTT